MGFRSFKASLAFVVFLLCTVQTQASVLEFIPHSPTVSVGETFNVDLVISGLGDHTAPSMAHWQMQILTDASIVESTNVTFGTHLDLGFGSSQSGGFSNSVFVRIELRETSFASEAILNSLQPSSFILAALTFNAIAPGTAPMNMYYIRLEDPQGDDLHDGLEVRNAIITVVEEVPEPTTLALMGLGLAGIGYRRHRTKKVA